MVRKSPLIANETLRLSRYMASAVSRPLPAYVVEKAKHHILDTIAAMISGSRLWPGEQAISYVKTLGGVREASVLATRIKTSAVNAAFTNGMFAHADETDDSHPESFTHPGSAIVPAALAAAEKVHADGRSFLRAVVLGYDVGCRLMKALDVASFRAVFRSSHSYGGTFGAGAAAGALFDIDEEKARHLLSYCAQLASGCGAYMRDRGHIEKAFVYSGKSAHNGVMAASLVQAGFTGADDVFSGERNFLDAYASKPHITALSDGLGRHYEIMGTNIKKWCVGSPIQAILDSVDALINLDGVTEINIESVDLCLSPHDTLVVNNRPFPNVNAQHLAALMLVDGRLSFDSCHDVSRMKDPRIVRFKKRVRLVPTDSLTDITHSRQAIVKITTHDGSNFVRHTRAVRGTTDNPMSRDEVAAKARDLIDGIIGSKRAQKLIETIYEIESVKDVAGIFSL
jgi:2-methylcitrate dehydratase PrpD